MRQVTHAHGTDKTYHNAPALASGMWVEGFRARAKTSFNRAARGPRFLPFWIRSVYGPHIRTVASITRVLASVKLLLKRREVE